MAIDENPIEALRKQFELEDLSKSPVSELVIKASAGIAKFVSIPSALQSVLEIVNDKIGTDRIERIAIMLRTVADEVLKQDRVISQLRESQSAEQKKSRDEQEAGLVVDGARRASNTRSITRVQRIGIILARSIVAPASPDADEIEEMMRIATELTDDDIVRLNALVDIQARYLKGRSHIERYTAYQSWESGPWRTQVDPTLDSVFRKLESYGLVSAIAPNNTLNITADIQTRFVLLPKGLRFSELISRVPHS
jgi:hypothetical protein